MRRKQAKMTVVSFGCGIHACSKGALWEESLLLLDDMMQRSLRRSRNGSRSLGFHDIS